MSQISFPVYCTIIPLSSFSFIINTLLANCFNDYILYLEDCSSMKIKAGEYKFISLFILKEKSLP